MAKPKYKNEEELKNAKGTPIKGPPSSRFNDLTIKLNVAKIENKVKVIHI